VRFGDADANAAAGARTVNKLSDISIVVNEGGEGDAGYAPYATAMGAITLALGALAF